MKFLSLLGLLTAFGLAVPLAGALPIENETPIVNANTPTADGSPAPRPKLRRRALQKMKLQGKLTSIQNCPKEVPNPQQSAPPQTNTPATAPAAPPPIGAVENPPLPKTYKPDDPIRHIGTAGSTYIPMDSWMYPALDRLSSLGYIDTAFFSLRPWTRLSVAHMLEATEAKLDANPQDVTAREIYDSLMRELLPDLRAPQYDAKIGTVYGGMLVIGGTPLNDSFHFGQTVINNYGRPYWEGFNMNLGGSARGKAGRFSFDIRGEYQHAPSIPPYSLELQQTIAKRDGVPFVPNNRNRYEKPIPSHRRLWGLLHLGNGTLRRQERYVVGHALRRIHDLQQQC